MGASKIRKKATAAADYLRWLLNRMSNIRENGITIFLLKESVSEYDKTKPN